MFLPEQARSYGLMLDGILYSCTESVTGVDAHAFFWTGFSLLFLPNNAVDIHQVTLCSEVTAKK